MRAALVGVAVASMSLSGCLPLLAIAYDQNRQEDMKRERAQRMASEDKAYAQALNDVEAELSAKEAEALEMESANPRHACLLRAQYRLEACVKKRALQSRSSNEAVRALASGAACEASHETALRICAP